MVGISGICKPLLTLEIPILSQLCQVAVARFLLPDAAYPPYYFFTKIPSTCVAHSLEFRFKTSEIHDRRRVEGREAHIPSHSYLLEFSTLLRQENGRNVISSSTGSQRFEFLVAARLSACVERDQ